MSDKKQKQNHSTLHTVLLAVFSLICSLLIWVYVTDSNSADIEKDFPGVKVVFEGENTMRESRGLIISENDTNSVRVSLVGNRRTISALDPADLKVVIDLNGISKTGNYSLAPKIAYPGKVDTSTISSSVTSPGNISFYVDKLSSKAVQVVGVFNGSAAEGYTAEPLSFDTETVKIYGPEKILAHVDHALVEVGREDVDKTLTFESDYVLIGEDGNPYSSDEITFDRETVIVTLPISAIKTVDLIVDIVPGAGATKDNVSVSIEPDSITLTGDSETLAGVNSISLAKFDLSQLDEPLTETYKIIIPNNTENTSGVKEATVSLTMTGLAHRRVKIDKSYISIINNSVGYDAEVMNSSIDNVVIRGPESVLDSISTLNIRAVADLADYGTATGIITVPVRIYVDGTTEAGAYGEYTVVINVTKAEEKENED